jgi:hypothetical protein
MPVTMIASMSDDLVTIWARWATRMLVVVIVHQEVAGVAATSVSWSTGARGFWGDNSNTMVRYGNDSPENGPLWCNSRFSCGI